MLASVTGLIISGVVNGVIFEDSTEERIDCRSCELCEVRTEFMDAPEVTRAAGATMLGRLPGFDNALDRLVKLVLTVGGSGGMSAAAALLGLFSVCCCCCCC